MDGTRFPKSDCKLARLYNAQHPAQPAGLLQHYKGRNACDLPMADNGLVL